MELLIVIAVLGLLLGMLIPRLAGITDDTVDTVCDTNNKGTRYLTQMYINKYNAWPDGLTNLVDLDNENGQDYTAAVEGGAAASAGTLDSGIYIVTTEGYMPTFQHDDQGDDAQTLAAEFWTRNVPSPYLLNDGEVAELKDMGITTVYCLTGDSRDMQKYTLSETVVPDSTTNVVMMMGMSNTASAAAPALNFSAEYPVGNPEWIGRIMMAVNDKCDLVKKGILQASALCPGAVLAEEDFTHKEYILVLPRLEATMDKFGSDSAMVGAELYFYDSSADDEDGAKYLDFTFEAQSSWEFDMSCPEGHKWPDNDEDAWILSTGTGDGTEFANGTTYKTTNYVEP